MALPRFHAPLPSVFGQTNEPHLLPEDVSRHVQVVRLQPGDPLVLFDSGDCEWLCRIVEMGRRFVSVRVEQQMTPHRELRLEVELAIGMPANDRMDFLIEKATELGALSAQPLVCARSVLKLDGERAAKRVAHWNGVAVSSTEQSGRTRPMQVRPVRSLADWLSAHGRDASGIASFVLSTGAAPHLSTLLASRLESGAISRVVMLSGPEGGLTAEEELAAVEAGFARASLGPRVLRADTAPLAALALMSAYCEGAHLGAI